MKRFVWLTIIVLFCFAPHSFSQERSVVIKHIKSADSISAEIDRIKTYKESEISGGGGRTGITSVDSVCSIEGRYKGIAYFNYEINEVSKLNLNGKLLKDRTIIYIFERSILKLLIDNNYYYHFGGRYYTRDAKEIEAPDLNEKFTAFENVVKAAGTLFSN